MPGATVGQTSQTWEGRSHTRWMPCVSWMLVGVATTRIFVPLEP